MSDRRKLLGLVGDVLVDRDEPRRIFDDVRTVLETPDVLFGNCEAAYSDNPEVVPVASGYLTPGRRNLEALDIFDVMSLANNHTLDCGRSAMLDTARRLRSAGVIPVGAGPNLAEARSPAVLTVDGLRVAFLAYASVFPRGYEARADAPGLAPVRGFNVYWDANANYWTPGVFGTPVSIPHDQDYANLAEDLANARSAADVVVASFHWGDYSTPFALTDHERRTAHFAVDSGADIVVGHHHHTLRGVEWYRERPIFYGLGHFGFDDRGVLPESGSDPNRPRGDTDAYTLYPRAGWPLLPMHPDARMTMLAWVEIGEAGSVGAVGFLPATLTADGLVHTHSADSGEGRRVTDYVRRCCDTAELAVELAVDGVERFPGLATVRVRTTGT
jgi:poly-gamma-glutamate synthesis protein (capsule biosynthesis protein)